MKSLIKQLKKRKHLVFLDFEGTQFSHEMIAFGAIRVDLDFKYRIRKIYPGLKCYVKAKGNIGSYVQNLTGINLEMLQTNGVDYKEALNQLKKYCGSSFAKMVFLTFGNHDIRILNRSLDASPDASAEIVSHISKNWIDLSATLSQFVRDEKGNPLSLVNSLALFKQDLCGVNHDPLDDAKNLMFLYKNIMKNDQIIFEEYLKQLRNMRLFPEPVKLIITKLVNGGSVDSDEFKTLVRDYIS